MLGNRSILNGRAPARILTLVVLSLALLTAGITASTAVPATGGDNAARAEVSGKTIGYLDIFGIAPIEKRWFNAFKYATDRIGWKVIFRDTGANQAKALTEARNFINLGVDAIVTSSVPAEWMRPVLAQAKAKGILLVNIQTIASPGVYDSDIGAEEGPLATALANAIAAREPAGSEIGILYEPIIAGEVVRLKSIRANPALKRKKIKIVAEAGVPPGTAQDAVKGTVDMLTAHPKISAIVGVSTQHPAFIVAALRSAQKSHVRIYGFFADSLNAKLLQKHRNIVAIADSDVASEVYIAIDQLLKGFSGQALTKRIVVNAKPVIITRSSVTPGLLAEQGPVPYAKLAKPFLTKWKTRYGLGG